MVKINVPDTKELLPGMFVSVSFPFDNKGTSTDEAVSIMIPKSALVKKGQLTGVYTVSSENTAVLRWLKLGRETADEVEVLSGLSAGETYVLKAEGRLYNGAPLNVK